MKSLFSLYTTRKMDITVREWPGLHVLPASRLAEAAKRYPCTITLSYRGEEANAGEPFEVLSLGVPYMDTVTVRIRAPMKDQQHVWRDVFDAFYPGNSRRDELLDMDRFSGSRLRRYYWRD